MVRVETALKDLSVDGLRKWLILNYLTVRSLFVHPHHCGTQKVSIRSKAVKNYEGEAVPQNLHSALQRPKRHGHAAAASRGLKFTRPPSLPSGTPRRGPNALHAPLPSRPRLPERPHVHPLLQRDSGRPAPAGIVRARALLGGDAARGRPGWPGRLSTTKAAVTRAAFLASTLLSRRSRARPSGGPEWAEPRRSHAQSSPPAGAAAALAPQGNAPRRPLPGTNPSRTLDAPYSVQETRKIQNAPSNFGN